MVYTLTLNPALDYHLFFDDFEQGALNVPSRSAMHAGGKGINVSRVLQRLGIPSVCLGFVGGVTGDFICKELNEDRIFHRFIRVSGNTRVNIKMNNHGVETEVVGVSPEISSGSLQELFELIVEIVKPEDTLVISGSLPSSFSEDTYTRIIDLCPKGVRVFLDTRGKLLRSTLLDKIYAVKPNRLEMEEWAGVRLNSFEDCIGAAYGMLDKGVSYVLLSMGKEGAAIVSKEYAYRVFAPEGKLVSSVGAGDAMLAGFIFAMAKRLSLPDCLSFAAATGSATAFSEGLCEVNFIHELLENGMKVENILYICPTNRYN